MRVQNILGVKSNKREDTYPIPDDKQAHQDWTTDVPFYLQSVGIKACKPKAPQYLKSHRCNQIAETKTACIEIKLKRHMNR